MSLPESSGEIGRGAPLPGDRTGPVFPTPWAARAFALAVALNEKGLFPWSEWAELFGAELARDPAAHAADPERYWRAWLAALEEMIRRKGVGGTAELLALQDAWREAAEGTPHGEPIDLRPELKPEASRGRAPPPER